MAILIHSGVKMNPLFFLGQCCKTQGTLEALRMYSTKEICVVDWGNSFYGTYSFKEGVLS